MKKLPILIAAGLIAAGAVVHGAVTQRWAVFTPDPARTERMHALVVAHADCRVTDIPHDVPLKERSIATSRRYAQCLPAVELSARPAESLGAGAAGARPCDEPCAALQDQHQRRGGPRPQHRDGSGGKRGIAGRDHLDREAAPGREVPQRRPGQRPCGRGRRCEGDVYARPRSGHRQPASVRLDSSGTARAGAADGRVALSRRRQVAGGGSRSGKRASGAERARPARAARR